MRKLLNNPRKYVDDMLTGLLSAYGDRLVSVGGDPRVLARRDPPPTPRVGVVTAGGSGHLPLFLGYVGQGMLDGCTVGNVFASPPARRMAEMIRACNFGRGVLCVYGNYTGDVMNLSLAREMADFDGIPTAVVLGRDDVASSPEETRNRRRGVAGIVYVYKIAGAAAAAGLNLEEVARLAQKAADHTRSMGVALSPCVLPEIGRPSFSIAEGRMEIGMGIHGEPGIDESPLLTANETADLMLEKLTADAPLHAGDEVSVMVNGLGATPLEELLIVYGRLSRLINERGARVIMPHIGEFATSMEMTGLSVSLLRVDDELRPYLTAPAMTPFYCSMNK